MRSIETLTEVRDLQAAIKKLTGRETDSTDPRYLRERLASLRARKSAGEDIKRRNDPAAATSFSLPLSARRELSRICDREKLGVSEVVKLALAHWAKANGYRPEVFE